MKKNAKNSKNGIKRWETKRWETKGRFSIIKNTYLWLLIWLMLVWWSWLLFGLNVKFSSQFTGGVNLTIANTIEDVSIKDDLEIFFTEQWFSDTSVEISNQKDHANLTIKTNVEKDEKVNELSDDLSTFLIERKLIETNNDILNLTITGPSVWAYMQKATLWALSIGILFMAIYMLFSFATIRKYIPPFVLAGVTILTMLFDISIPVWAYGFWMMTNATIQVDIIFVIAILTTMWYSINDTIVIFDRIRENIQTHGEKEWWKIIYGKVFEKSLRQTMRRSLWTSISTLLVIVAMYFLGTWVIQGFAFTMWVWVVAGTFSSIFIATPLAYLLIGKYKQEKNKLD